MLRLIILAFFLFGSLLDNRCGYGCSRGWGRGSCGCGRSRGSWSCRLGIRIGSILGGLFGTSFSFGGSGCSFCSSLALLGIIVHRSFGGRLVCSGLGGLFGSFSCGCILSLLRFGFGLFLGLLSFFLGFLSSLLALLHRFFFLSFDLFLCIVCYFLSISAGSSRSLGSIDFVCSLFSLLRFSFCGFLFSFLFLGVGLDLFLFKLFGGLGLLSLGFFLGLYLFGFSFDFFLLGLFFSLLGFIDSRVNGGYGGNWSTSSGRRNLRKSSGNWGSGNWGSGSWSRNDNRSLCFLSFLRSNGLACSALGSVLFLLIIFISLLRCCGSCLFLGCSGLFLFGRGLDLSLRCSVFILLILFKFGSILS